VSSAICFDIRTSLGPKKMESVREKETGSGDSSDSNDQAAIPSSCSSHRSHKNYYRHHTDFSLEEVLPTQSTVEMAASGFERRKTSSQLPCAQSKLENNNNINSINLVGSKSRSEDCTKRSFPLGMTTHRRKKRSMASTTTSSGCVIIEWGLPRLHHFTIFILLAALTVSPKIPVAECARFPPNLQSGRAGHLYENGMHYATLGDENVLHSKHCSHVYPKPHEVSKSDTL